MFIAQDTFCSYISTLQDTEILPNSDDSTRQMNSLIAWFTYAGETFRVPLSILHLPPTEGSMNLIDVQAKCNDLFIRRCLIRPQ
jgi:hypothetical protein